MTFDAATRTRLVGLFVSESEESVATLGGLARALRAGADGAELTEFGRVAHGLKGAAAALGFDALARALHDLEDLALGLRAGGGDPGERRRRVDLALEHLGEGFARMAASGAEAFPDDLMAGLLEAVRAPEGATDAPAAGPAPAPAAAASPAPGAPAPDPSTGERLNVPAVDVDAALRLASSLARGAAQLHEALARDGGALVASAQAIAASAQGLEALVSSLRLLPAESALSGLEQEVAELGARLGKQVALAVSGRDVRADRRTLHAARGMIRHLVRNAVDHGLETAEARRGAGKAPAGRLEVSLEARESALRIRVADDGAGFDVAAIRQDLSRRTGEAERIASLSDEEVLQRWAFEGGSTRTAATEISGRGLGLSAVAKLARDAGGGIHVGSARGVGSSVTFTLPLEVYAVELLTVTAAGRLFGIPLQAVEQALHLAAAGAAVHDGPAGRTLAVGEAIVPLDALAEVLGIEGPPGPERFAVVVQLEGGIAALAVEEVGSVTGVVPEAIPGVAQADALVTGIAQLGDGAIVSLLSPRLLLSSARAVRAAPRAPRSRPAAATEAPAAPAPAATPPRGRALEVVLAEDSLATREVLRVLLEEQGFRVRLAADGEEALQRIAEGVPDVLVSDLNMPRRDGLSLTQELRRRTATSRLPIVLLTSQDDDATRAAGAAAGADAYLVKSRFNAAVLQETLAGIGVRAAR